MDTKTKYKKNAVIISAFLALSALFSLLYLLVPKSGGPAAGGYTAEIYQDGSLLYRIPLSDISENRTFTVMSAEGGINEIEIRQDSIGVISADCPDRLCVHQGFITNDKLPVTCLPNRLVILLRPAPGEPDNDITTPDTITY
ncbi:MAG: NusG domain II-containing protein [Lachnospiraceae bacterium]|nr:NusG domain II-containing protein [Lachnospiraceae bacterium]